MQIKPADIETYLRNPTNCHPLVLIYGPDQGLVSERVSSLQNGLLEGNDDPFARLTLDSEEIANDPGRLADEASTIALFGGKRVIRIKLSGNRSIAKSLQVLLDEPPTNATILIEAGDLKKSNAVRSAFEKSKVAATVPCYLDTATSLKGLVRDEIARADIRLHNEAESKLLSRLGENRQTSRNEIQKLILYAEDRGEITVDDVEALVGDVSANFTDDTVDATLMGDIDATLSNFHKALEMGQAPFLIIAALQRHLTTLQLLSHAVAEGISAKEAVDRARPPIFFSRKRAVTAHLSLWQAEDLVKAQERCLEAISQSRLKPSVSESIIASAVTTLAGVAMQRRKRAGRP